MNTPLAPDLSVPIWSIEHVAYALDNMAVDTAREYTYDPDFPPAKAGFKKNLWLREDVLTWFANRPPAQRSRLKVLQTPSTGTVAARAARATTRASAGSQTTSRPTAATKDASAVRVMLDCCRRVGLLTYEEYRTATAFDVSRGGIQRPPAGHYLSEDDVTAILHATETGPGHVHTRIRDRALLTVMASSGARGHEVTGIDVADTHLAEYRAWLRRTKSGTQRNAWFHPSAVQAVARWLEVRGTVPGPLFVPLSRTGRPLLEGDRRLSTFQVWKVVRRRARDAGFEGITPHDLRRFVISVLLRTHDVAKVAKIVGHRDPTTTVGYDRRPQEEQREAVASLVLPLLGAPRPP